MKKQYSLNPNQTRERGVSRAKRCRETRSVSRTRERVKRCRDTRSVSRTQKIAKELAKEIFKNSFLNKEATVIGLVGDLGAGKTSFAQGFAKGLGIKERILSPTFIILKRFQVSPKDKPTGQAGFRFQDFYHIDCYRTESPKEILSLGFKEIIANPKNIIIIEWADMIKKIMPENTIWIELKFVDKKKRKIMLK